MKTDFGAFTGMWPSWSPGSRLQVRHAISTFRFPADAENGPREVTSDRAQPPGAATEYTENGSVRIAARFESARLTIEVTDTGPVIPADKLDYFFEPFTRVDEVHTDLTSGAGPSRLQSHGDWSIDLPDPHG